MLIALTRIDKCGEDWTSTDTKHPVPVRREDDSVLAQNTHALYTLEFGVQTPRHLTTSKESARMRYVFGGLLAENLESADAKRPAIRITSRLTIMLSAIIQLA